MKPRYRIHVIRQNLFTNKGNKNNNLPVFQVINADGQALQAHAIEIHGPSRFVFNHEGDPEQSGVTAWLETDAEIWCEQ